MIYFPDFTFNNIPLVWDYNEKTNQAVCTFFTTEKIENSRAILLQLSSKEYAGITLTEESAIIEDMEDMHCDKIVKQLMESKKSAASMGLIADKIVQCIKIKGWELAQLAAEKTDTAFQEGHVRAPEDRQTLQM